MDSLRFYKPPAKPGARSNGRSTTSNLRIPSSRWERKDSVALGASQKPSGVPYNSNLTQSQNRTGPLQKDSLNSFSVPEIGLNGTTADREMASMPDEHAVISWDDMNPLSYQKPSDRPHRPYFRDPIEVDSGHDSSDDSGSDSGHEASSATTSTCGMSPGVSSSNEGQMKNTKTGGKETERLIAAALNPREQRDSSWPDIDDFFNSDLEAGDGAAEGKCHETGNIEEKPGPDGAKDGQAGDGSEEMYHSVDGAEDQPGDGDRVLDGSEDVITDPEMEGFEMDDGGFYSKDGRRAGVGVDAEGEQNPSDAQALQALMASSPRVARRGRGRPRRSRPTIVVGNTSWEVTKVAGDEQSGEGRVFKVQAEAWLAEKDVSSLRDAIATYWGKQGPTRRKRKSICGGQRRSARRRRD
ncbi:MAG: hypothetical protein LQ350_008522 [Teloschistes chrysophthalmus]|nr:MAG: hypothetical protein LQ350_008522 [Niorma chrysophthalma]